MGMWKIHKMEVYEISDTDTNRVVATGLDEGQAQKICDRYNKALQEMKWGQDGAKKAKD